MTTRTAGIASGWRWLWNAVNLGSGNPRAIFGGAALIAAVVFAVAIVLSIVLGLLAIEGGTAQLVASTVVSVPLLVIMAALMAGYLKVIDAVENGRPAQATGVFSAFGDRTTWMRAIGVLLALALLQYVLIGGLVALVAPETGRWYLENLEATAAAVDPAAQMAVPAGFGRAMAIFLVVVVLVYAAQAISLGQVALRNRGLGEALRDGFAGALRNALPLALLLLISLVAMVVVVVVVAVVAMVIAALAAAGGTGLLMVLGIVIGVPLYLAFLVVMLVVSCGVMYFMWRDVCGDGDMGGDDRQVAA